MFRNRKNNVSVNGHCDAVYVTDVKVVEEELEGTLTQRVVHYKRNVLDPKEQPDLPSPEEMSIKNQLDAGIPPKAMNIGSMLNPTDPETLQSMSQNGLLDVLSNAPTEVVETSAPVDNSPHEVPVEPTVTTE